jgi:hypothetical protein
VFVPDGFVPPTRLRTSQLVLEPLGVEHNEADYEAWTTSIDHIRATPGFTGKWPRPLTLDENRADLQGHAEDFAARTGFTYTVLDPATRDVVGCVYIYPADGGGARVRSWVRASRVELDRPLWQAVSAWLDEAWPFERVEYAPR